MRKSVKYLIAGISVTAIAVAAVVITSFDIRPLHADKILARYKDDAEYEKLTINYPQDGTLFPPEIVPPVFRWDDDSGSDLWLISINFKDHLGRPNKNQNIQRPGRCADILPGSEPAFCRCRQGSLTHSMALRRYLFAAAASNRPGEPAGMRKLSLLLQGR